MARAYYRFEKTGIIPAPDEVAHVPETFENDVRKFAKAVARQRGYLLDEQGES